MKKEILAGEIFYYKNLIPNPAEFILKIESLDSKIAHPTLLSRWKPWVSSTRSDDVFGEYRSGSPIFMNVPEDESDSAFIISTIHNIFNECTADYSVFLKKDLGFLPKEVTIRKYHPGGQMGPHIDCEDDDDEARLTASMVLYLNDDYEGGDVVFEKQGISIKPEAGSLLIFPSVKPYYHESKTIINGYKYMCPNFMFNRSKLI